MMNTNDIQAIQTLSPELPAPHNTESPQFPLDPTNPIVWIVVLTMLLGNTDEVIHAVIKLIEAIASFRKNTPPNH